MDLKRAFDAVREVQTPLQALVFLATLGLIALSRWRYKRYSLTLKSIRDVREDQRADLLSRELGEPLPPMVNPVQFLIYKRQRYLFLFAISALIAVAIVVMFTRAVMFHQDVSIGTNSGTLNIDNGRSLPQR